MTLSKRVFLKSSWNSEKYDAEQTWFLKMILDWKKWKTLFYKRDKVREEVHYPTKNQINQQLNRSNLNQPRLLHLNNLGPNLLKTQIKHF